MSTEFFDHILVPAEVLVLLDEIKECYDNKQVNSSILSADLLDLTQSSMAKVLQHELAADEYCHRANALAADECLAALAWVIRMIREKQFLLDELQMSLSTKH